MMLSCQFPLLLIHAVILKKKTKKTNTQVAWSQPAVEQDGVCSLAVGCTWGPPLPALSRDLCRGERDTVWLRVLFLAGAAEAPPRSPRSSPRLVAERRTRYGAD